MKNEIVKAEDYELSAEKGHEVTASFKPAIEKKQSLMPEYDKILTLEINKETCKMAGDLRKKLVKVRTQGVEATRKAQKNFALKFGQFVDAFAKKEKIHLELMESNLSDIERHYENLERERIEAIEAERKEQLKEFTTAIPSGLGVMDQEVFRQLIIGAKYSHEQKIAEEKRIEAERIAKEKADKEEQERIRKENERMKAEAVEREKKERIEREKREKEEADRREKEAEERRIIEEKARKEREAVEARLEEERKERARVEAENARIEAEKKEEEARKVREEAERVARASDKAHRKEVNNAALKSIVLAMSEDFEGNQEQAEVIAMAVIKAIALGKIENVQINY